MKKFFVLTVFIVSSFSLFPLEINLSATSKSVTTVVEGNNGKFLVSLSDSLSVSPTFTFTGDYVTFGEIRPKDYFTFEKVSVPALNPKYSGFTYENNGFFLFCSNPVVNPDSIRTAGISYENNALYGFASFEHNPDYIQTARQSFQLDWQDFQAIVFDIGIGGKAKHENIYCDLLVSSQKLSFETGFRKKPFSISFRETSADGFSYALSFTADGFLETKFDVNLKESSKYLGQSREQTYTLSSVCTFFMLKIKTSSCVQFSAETGKFAWTDLEISFSKSPFDLSFKSRFERTQDKKNGFGSVYIKAETDNASLSFNDGKFYLTIKAEKHFENKDFLVSINQNGEFTFNIKMLF